MKADLHIHSTFSDGTCRVEEIVIKAKKKKIDVICVSDHDTLDGSIAAGKLAPKHGIKTITGTEFTAYESVNGKEIEIHILGYCLDPANEELQKYLRAFREKRVQRIEKMVEILNKMGIKIKLEEVLNSGAPGRLNLARLIAKKGYAGSIQEAFSKFLAEGTPAYYPKMKVDAEKIINLIKRAKGVPVIAHPAHYARKTNVWLLIEELIKKGCEGVEVFHPDNPPEFSYALLEFSLKNGLMISGGSDYHGKGFESRAELGEVFLPEPFVKNWLECEKCWI